jgi:hypothetical protein
LNFLFSAVSFNDAIKRVTYLRSYRKNRETQAVAIAKSETLLQEKIQLLGSTKKERMGTLVVQNEQLKVLQTDKKEQDKVMAQLKGKEKELTTQIRDKEKQRQKVQQAFQAIIRREIAEAEKLAAREAARVKALEDSKRAAKELAELKEKQINEEKLRLAAEKKAKEDEANQQKAEAQARKLAELEEMRLAKEKEKAINEYGYTYTILASPMYWRKNTIFSIKNPVALSLSVTP